jgi:hypothetical protein
MTESDVSTSIINWIRDQGGWAIKNHASQAQGRGEPDVLGVLRGVSLAIETKLPGEEPTKIQRYCLAKWKRGGALAIRAESVADVRVALRGMSMFGAPV